MEYEINNTPEPAGTETAEYERDMILSQLRAQQNYPLAFGCGLLAAFVCAILWAVITVATQYQIGYMAIAVGFAVGFAMRLGKGIDRRFAITGSILALLGCLLGNIFSIIGFVMVQEKMGLFQTLFALDYSYLPEIMVENFHVMDLLFYGIAIRCGYLYSAQRISE